MGNLFVLMYIYIDRCVCVYANVMCVQWIFRVDFLIDMAVFEIMPDFHFVGQSCCVMIKSSARGMMAS